jgi:N-acetyl-anhydromuramyl-L-alanine amidase AmpD
MKVDDTGWLEANASGLPPIVRVPSVRTSPLLDKFPHGIVWHWTGGHSRSTTYAKALADEIRTFNRQSDRAASWHVAIAKDGTLIQSVPFNLGSWHVGRPGRIGAKPVRSEGGGWDPTSWVGGKLVANVNSVTIGVELVNAGRLEKVGDKFYCWPFWLHTDNHGAGPDPKYEIDSARAVQTGAQWHDDYPQLQREAAQRLLTALVIKYKWTREVCGYGHVMFDPSRKEDPGPLWLDTYLPALLDGVFGPL